MEALLFGEWFEPLVEWLDSEGEAQDLKRDKEKWEQRFRMDADPPIQQEEIDHIEKVIGDYLAKHTKAEIYAAAEARGIGWSGVCSIGEVMNDEQLKARSFLVEVEHPELGGVLAYPRPPFKATETPLKDPRRAPLIGEHNEEIYVDELGFSKEDLVFLKESGVL